MYFQKSKFFILGCLLLCWPEVESNVELEKRSTDDSYCKSQYESYVSCYVTHKTLPLFCPSKEWFGSNLRDCYWDYGATIGTIQIGGYNIQTCHPISLPPQPADKQGLRFDLYTCTNPTTPQIIPVNNFAELLSSNFDFSKDTKFIIGGYLTGNASLFVPYPAISVLLNYCKCCNVFIINWQKGSETVNYYQAVANTRLVGRISALFIQYMINNNYLLSKIHLIGASLGTEIAGIIGRYFSGKMPRISALEPSGPSFTCRNKDFGIFRTNAVFVDVVHTNAFVLGFGECVGHMDFVVNSGVIQPACIKAFLENPYPQNFLQAVTFCSHVYSVLIYIFSATPNASLTAYRCPDYYSYLMNSTGCHSCSDPSRCAQMGANSIQYKESGYKLPASEMFFLDTGTFLPFSNST